MTHIVTAPLAIAYKPDGSQLFLYQHSEVPENISDDEVKRLVTSGHVDKVDGRTTKTKAPTSESN